MTDICGALMTAPTMDVAQTIVRSAVEQGLAACGNIVPQVISIFRWEGAIQNDAEVLVIFKTTTASFERLSEHVRTTHPYDVPELLQLSVADGSGAYVE